MSRRIAALVGLSLVAISCAAPPPQNGSTRPTFTNPINARGADPWLEYVNGEYYLAVTNGRDVRLRHAAKFADLASATDEIVWSDSTPGRDRSFWAPEFHRLPNEAGEMRWYLYYTASGAEEPSHRMFVAESARDDIRGPYAFKTQLKTDPEDKFYAIDGTVFEATPGVRYFVWCGRPSETGQGLFISRMTNPWTLVGERTALHVDGFGCKFIREGPAVLRHRDELFLVYSMCGADTPDYRLGMLTAKSSGDLTDASAWKQYPRVVFARNDTAGIFGPGHNQFFRSPDGKEDWLVYHAKTSARMTYADRETRAQQIRWNTDGTPDFGNPVADGVPAESPGGE